MLDPQFALYSAGARRLYHFEFHRDQHLLAAEVRRTLDAIGAGVPGRIARGSLTSAEAEQLSLPWLAIARDLEEQDRWLREGAGATGWPLADKLREIRRDTGIAWETKVQVLRREIELRRTGYGAEIEKGRLTRDQAKCQLERIEAAHDLYWRHGFAFDGTREELSAHGAVVQDRDIAECGPAKVPSSCTSDEAFDELNRRYG